jgi:cytochrome c biogenesis protein CcdA
MDKLIVDTTWGDLLNPILSVLKSVGEIAGFLILFVLAVCIFMLIQHFVILYWKILRYRIELYLENRRKK